MNGGMGANGHRLLSRRATSEMQRLNVKGRSARQGIGLAWMLNDLDGSRMFGHNGETNGQYSHLVVLPQERLAIAALTNGGNAGGLFSELVGGLIKSLTRKSMPGLPSVKDNVRLRPEELLGIYQNINSTAAVREGDNGIEIVISPTANPDSRNRVKPAFASPRLAVLPGGVLLQWNGRKGEPASGLRVGSRYLARTG